MRKHLIFGLTLGSALAIGSFAVAAQSGPHGGWGHHGGEHGMMALHQLKLSDTQQASIKQITQTNREQSKSQRQALDRQRQAFEAMQPNEPGYQAAAAALAQAEGNATTARVQRMATLRAQIYNVLTPAQQSQLATLKAQQQAKRQQWQQFKAQQKAGGSSPDSGQ